MDAYVTVTGTVRVPIWVLSFINKNLRTVKATSWRTFSLEFKIETKEQSDIKFKQLPRGKRRDGVEEGKEGSTQGRRRARKRRKRKTEGGGGTIKRERKEEGKEKGGGEGGGDGGGGGGGGGRCHLSWAVMEVIPVVGKLLPGRKESF